MKKKISISIIAICVIVFIAILLFVEHNNHTGQMRNSAAEIKTIETTPLNSTVSSEALPEATQDLDGENAGTGNISENTDEKDSEVIEEYTAGENETGLLPVVSDED